MRFAILGCGSIGARHLRNLLTIGQRDLIAFDPSSDRRQAIAAAHGVKTCGRLDDVWHHNPDVALITAPPHLHLELAQTAAENNCHLFIEKPLAHQIDGLSQLQDTVENRGLITMVACNMRFHHGPATAKRLLDEGVIGRIMSAALDAGQYMPDWHPDQDYRQRYSAQHAMGGGVVLDGIHEIDYARWLMGEVVEVFCYGGKLSALDIDVEDTANILMKFDAGFSAVVHIDYLQRAYARSCKIIGEEGTIIWDIDSHVRWFSAKTGRWQKIEPLEDYTINDMYIAEMQHFLSCIIDGRATMLDVKDGICVTRLALAIKQSMYEGQKVIL